MPMYTGENNLRVAHPVGECFQNLVSNPVIDDVKRWKKQKSDTQAVRQVCH